MSGSSGTRSIRSESDPALLAVVNRSRKPIAQINPHQDSPPDAPQAKGDLAAYPRRNPSKPVYRLKKRSGYARCRTWTCSLHQQVQPSGQNGVQPCSGTCEAWSSARSAPVTIEVPQVCGMPFDARPRFRRKRCTRHQRELGDFRGQSLPERCAASPPLPPKKPASCSANLARTWCTCCSQRVPAARMLLLWHASPPLQGFVSIGLRRLRSGSCAPRQVKPGAR